VGGGGGGPPPPLPPLLFFWVFLKKGFFFFFFFFFFFWDGVSELTGESVMWWTTLQSNTCGSYHFVSLGWQLTRIDVACSVCTFAPGYALFLCWSLAVSTELLPAVCFSIYPAKEWNNMGLLYLRVATLDRRACAIDQLHWNIPSVDKSQWYSGVYNSTIAGPPTCPFAIVQKFQHFGV